MGAATLVLILIGVWIFLNLIRNVNEGNLHSIVAGAVILLCIVIGGAIFL